MRLAVLLLAFVAAGQAAAGVRARDLGRPTGSRADATTRRAERRNALVRWSQPDLRRGDRRPRLRASQLDRATARIRALRPDIDPAVIRRGFEQYRATVGRVRALARERPDAVRATRVRTIDGLAQLRIDLLPPPGPVGPRERLVVVAGMHGNERAGVEAALRMIARAARDPAFRRRYDLTVVPLVAPTALVLDERETLRGHNANRHVGDGLWIEETLILRDMFATHVDRAVDLHTAGLEGRNGMYLITGDGEDPWANRVLAALESAALMDVEGAGGRPATVGPYVLERLGSTFSTNTGTAASYARSRDAKAATAEAPTRWPWARQVRGLVKLGESLLRHP